MPAQQGKRNTETQENNVLRLLAQNVRSRTILEKGCCLREKDLERNGSVPFMFRFHIFLYLYYNRLNGGDISLGKEVRDSTAAKESALHSP